MSNPSTNSTSETILVLAPTGLDGELTTRFLSEMGFANLLCRGMFDLCHRVEQPCGALLVAEEALYSSSSSVFLECLRKQETWSDLPVIVITSGGKQTAESLKVFQTFRREANITLVERPFRKVTLTSVLEGALRARRKQYQMRELLDAQRKLHEESTRQLSLLKASEEKTRAALMREEQRARELQSLMDTVPVAVWVGHGPNCKEITGNAHAYALLRVPKGANMSVTGPAAEASALQFKLFKNGQPIPEMDYPVQRAARTGKPIWDEDVDVVFPDGSSVSVLINAVPLRDALGQVTGSIATGMDVTERRAMMRNLREREGRLQFILKAAELGAWDLDLTTGTIQVSAQFKKIFGFSPDTEITDPEQFRTLVLPDHQVRVRAAVQTAIQETGEYECEYPIRWPDGSVHWIYSRGEAIRDSAGKILTLAGVTVDISPRKQAEQALATQVTRLQLLSDSIAHLLTARDPHEAVRGLFPKVAEHLGLDTFLKYMVTPEGDALELRTFSGIPEADARSAKRLGFGESICGTVAQTRQPMIATHIQESKDHDLDTIRSWGIRAYGCHPLLVGERLIGTLSFASHTRDEFTEDELQFLRVISQYVSIALDRLRTESELQALNDHLEQEVASRTAKLTESVEELEGFSYSITHDLRAPLRAMQSFAAILQEEAASRLSPTDQDYLHRIITSSHRMDRLIRDVLAYSRVLRMDLRLEPVDLAALIRGILQSYPNYSPSRADIYLEGEFCPVLGNEAALTQCVSNFLTNAIKFVSPGVKPKVRILSELRGDRVRVWFEDNGIGIAPEYRDRIFHLFQRLHREYEGTGIGLSIVRKAVERMGGSVGVESEPGHGSRFWFELQCAPPDHE